MVEHQLVDEIDIILFIEHYYKRRGFIFSVVLVFIFISLLYSLISYLIKPPTFQYTSQSVIEVTISEKAENQKSMFTSYLVSEKVFNESAKSIGLDADYNSWRSFIVVEDIKDSKEIIFKISAVKTDKLIELNRRIVSNTIFQTKNILTGINVKTLKEAEILDVAQNTKEDVNFLGNLLFFIVFGLLSSFGWLTFNLIINRRVGRIKDIEGLTDLTVIGTIPDFEKLTVSEDINLRNFIRGLTWKKRM
jgi:capsular polysaccharide biosynthesis protein